MQHRPVGLVAERHVFETNFAAAERDGFGLRVFLDLGREIKKFEYPLGGGESALDGVVEADELVDGVEEPAHERHEGEDGTERDIAEAEDDHGPAADADQEHGDIARAVEDLVVEAEHAHGLVDQAHLGEVGAQVVAAGGGFAFEGLDFADAGDVLLDGGADDGLLLAHVAVDRPQVLAHALDGGENDGDGREREQEETRAHADHDQRHGDQVRRRIEQDVGIAQHLLHLVGVADGARHDGAGAFGVEIGHGELVEVLVHPVLHVEHDALADARAQPPHGHADGVGDHDHDEQDGQIAGGPEQPGPHVGQNRGEIEHVPEERKRAAAHHAVDVPRQAGGGDEIERRVEEIEQIDRPELAAVGSDEFQRPPQQAPVRADLGGIGGGLSFFHCASPPRTCAANGSRPCRDGPSCGWWPRRCGPRS